MKKQRLTKAAFVRSFAPGVPARRIAEAAAKRGMKLSANYVYLVRSATKRAKRVSLFSVRLEEALLLLAAELGLSRAIALLQKERLLVSATYGKMLG